MTKTYVSFIFGLVFFVTSALFLFFYEQSFVKLAKLTDFIGKNAIELNSGTLSPINNNKLVKITGVVVSDQTLSDGIVTVPKAIALKRTAEIYQWHEIHSSSRQIYQYKKEWNRELINSDNFEKIEYKNPKKYRYKPMELYTKNVSLGRFYLSEEIVKNINTMLKLQQLPYSSKFKIYNGFYFTGKDFDNPDVGDEKLFYYYVPSGIKLSIIAKQVGNQLVPMSTKYGDIIIVSNGSSNIKEILKEYKTSNSGNIWGIRGICFLLMFIGLNLIFQSTVNSAWRLPVFEKIVQLSDTFHTIIIALALETIIVSLSWIVVRPEFSASALFLSMVTLIFLRKKKKIIISE